MNIWKNKSLNFLNTFKTIFLYEEIWLDIKCIESLPNCSKYWNASN